jgi:hypothetical protein
MSRGHGEMWAEIVPVLRMKVQLKHNQVFPQAAVLFNPLNAELNPNCHLLALLGAHLIFHVSRIRVNF